MVLLSKLKKQINQFVTPEIEVIPDSEINFYPKQFEEKNEPLKKNNEEKKETTVNTKSAYSHGLEAIYAIETIDLKTIKPLNVQHKKEESKEKKYIHPIPELEFSFELKQTMPSFILNESIHVLDLSKQCVQILTDLNFIYLRDLLKIDYQHPDLDSKFKVISSELKSKLETYLEGKELFNCVTIDFEAWIKSLIFENHIKYYFLLKEYNLTHLLSITPMMSVEIKRAKKNEIEKYIIESKEELKRFDRQELNKANKKIIIMTFISHWVNGRYGIVKEYELMDYLEQLSESKKNFQNCLNFLSDLYEEGNFYFKNNFIEIYPEVYCLSNSIYNKFKKIENMLLSYFPKKKENYLLMELLAYILKELSSSWDYIEEKFIEKVLYTSPYFNIYKNDHYEVEVSYNLPYNYL